MLAPNRTSSVSELAPGERHNNVTRANRIDHSTSFAVIGWCDMGICVIKPFEITLYTVPSESTDGSRVRWLKSKQKQHLLSLSAPLTLFVAKEKRRRARVSLSVCVRAELTLACVESFSVGGCGCVWRVPAVLIRDGRCTNHTRKKKRRMIALKRNTTTKPRFFYCHGTVMCRSPGSEIRSHFRTANRQIKVRLESWNNPGTMER